MLYTLKSLQMHKDKSSLLYHFFLPGLYILFYLTFRFYFTLLVVPMCLAGFLHCISILWYYGLSSLLRPHCPSALLCGGWV